MILRSTRKLSCSCLAAATSSTTSSSKRGPLDFRIESALNSIRKSNQSLPRSSSTFNSLHQAESQIQQVSSQESQSSSSSSSSPVSASNSTSFQPPDNHHHQDYGLKIHLAGLNLPTLVTKLLIQASHNSHSPSNQFSPQQPLTIPSLLQRQSQIGELNQALEKHNLTEDKLLAICNSIRSETFKEAASFLIQTEEEEGFQPNQWPNFLILRLFQKIDEKDQDEILKATEIMLKIFKEDVQSMEPQFLADLILLFGRKLFAFQRFPSSFGDFSNKSSLEDQDKSSIISSIITGLTCMTLSTSLRILRIQPPSIHESSISFHASTLSSYVSFIQDQDQDPPPNSNIPKAKKRFIKFTGFLSEYLKILQPFKSQDEKIKRSFEVIVRFSRYVREPFPQSSDQVQSVASDEIQKLLEFKGSVNRSRGRNLTMRRTSLQVNQLKKALKRRLGRKTGKSLGNMGVRSSNIIINEWKRELRAVTSDSVNLAGITKTSPLGPESASRLLDLSLSALGFISPEENRNSRLDSRLRYRNSNSIRPIRQSLNSIHSRKSILMRKVENDDRISKIDLPLEILCLLMTLCNAKRLPEFSIRLFNFYILKRRRESDDKIFLQVVTSLLNLGRSSDAISQVKLWCFEGVNLSKMSSPRIEDQDQSQKLLKLNPTTKLLNTLIRGLHLCGSPQVGFQIYQSFTQHLNVQPNSTTLSLLIKSSRLTRASKSSGMGWGSRSRTVLHRPESWSDLEDDLGLSSLFSSSLEDSTASTSTLQPIPISPIIQQKENPLSIESSMRLFQEKKNLRSYWSEDKIPAPILMKRIFEKELFEQFPELKDKDMECGKNPLELGKVRDGMSWWTRREMRAKDFENWMEDKWKGLVGGGGGKSQADEVKVKEGEFFDQNSNGFGKDVQKTKRDSSSSIKMDPKLFHEYLLLLKYMNSPMMNDHFSNLPSTSTSSISSLQSELPKNNYEDSILVLNWMKHLDLIPLRRSLNLCLLLLSEDLPPISFFSSRKVIKNPIHGNRVFESRPEGRISAAGPLHDWLKDWLSEDEIPTEWEIGNYFKWGRKYEKRGQIERSRRRLRRESERDPLGNE